MKNQLLYMWIKETDYCCFKNAGFNFSPEYEFSFENNCLSLKGTGKVNVYSNNLFVEENNVCNITAIVGNNGAGKTTALKKIIEMWKLKYYERIPSIRNFDSLYVYVENNTLIIVDNTVFGNVFISSSVKDFFPNIKRIILNKRKMLFNSLRVESTVVYISSERKDTVSFGGLMSSNFIPLTPKQIENVRNVFARRKTPNLIKSPLRNKHFNFENFLFGYLYSKYGSVLLCNNRLSFALALASKNERRYPYSINVDGNLNSFPNLLEFHKNDSLRVALLKMLIRELLPLVDSDKKNKFVDSILPIFNNKIMFDEQEINLIKDLAFRCIRDNRYLDSYIDIAIYEINVACEILEDYSPDDLIKGIENMNISKMSELYNLVLSKEREYSFLFKYMCIFLDGSDGEIAYLRHLAYLVFASNPNINPYYKKHVVNENVLILLDEADIHLHPEWQRKLISNIVDSINLIFKDKNVQIIFTTHSPIVLSDIPSQNIIYIGNKDHERRVFKNYEKKTFGANIYDLYNDSFFFDGSSVMGDYARQYIDNLYDTVSNSKINDYKEYIELIDDENIKNAFASLTSTNESNDLAIDKEKQIESIKRNIEYLQGILLEIERDGNNDKN